VRKALLYETSDSLSFAWWDSSVYWSAINRKNAVALNNMLSMRQESEIKGIVA
jgi:hypothetical protein